MTHLEPTHSSTTMPEAPDFHYCEMVHVYDDEGTWVRGMIDGYPPEDVAADVPIKVVDGPQKGEVVQRPRSRVYFFSLARWMEGKRGKN